MKTSTVNHIAKLAHLPISPDQETALAAAFDQTLMVINALQDVDVTGVSPTHQVTGLTNVLREDVVDTTRMFSQEDALRNAANTHNGYIVVDQVISQD